MHRIREIDERDVSLEMQEVPFLFRPGRRIDQSPSSNVLQCR